MVSHSMWLPGIATTYFSAAQYNKTVCRNMICMHALIGCDTNSSCYRVNKKVAFDMLLKCPNLLHKLGESFETTIVTYKTAVCSLLLLKKTKLQWMPGTTLL